jgi:hypothetical protein
MRGSRRALGLAGAVTAAAIAIAACGDGDGDNPPEPNDGTAIVSIGDSVASGEGNPAKKGPRWEDRRCHRSATAGQTFAAEEARQGRPEIGFFSFACSGRASKGPARPLPGIEAAAIQPARAQIGQVADVAAVTEGGLAAVLVSIGANDVGFSKVVKFCAVVPRCWEQHFNPDFPLVEAGPKQPTLEEWVNGRLAALPDRVERLRDALASVVEPDRVIIVEYFDPTTGADGSDCTMLFGGVKPAESRWARENVLQPLNAEIEKSAEDHGWQVVTGVDESFKGHGLCAGKQRWVRTLGEGLSGRPLPLTPVGVDLARIQIAVGSTAGTLHPNEAGHRQIAELIAPSSPKCSTPRTSCWASLRPWRAGRSHQRNGSTGLNLASLLVPADHPVLDPGDRDAMSRSRWSWLTMITPSVLGREPVEDPGDLPPGFGIEIGGRLIGEHHGRVVGERPGDRDPLLLPAREVAGPVLEALAQPEPRQRLRGAGARLGRGRARSRSGTSTFSCAVSAESRLKLWKTKPRCSSRAWARSASPAA